MLEFQAHIFWVITVDFKVRLGQVKSEFHLKSQKLTRSVRASKLSIFTMKYNSVQRQKNSFLSIYHANSFLCALADLLAYLSSFPFYPFGH